MKIFRETKRYLGAKKAETEFGFIAKTAFGEGLANTIQWHTDTAKTGTL